MSRLPSLAESYLFPLVVVVVVVVVYYAGERLPEAAIEDPVPASVRRCLYRRSMAAKLWPDLLSLLD